MSRVGLAMGAALLWALLVPSPAGAAVKATGVARDAHGRIARSQGAKDAFKVQHPCPATGKASGPCRGYVIDHIKPLACGGADDPSNMQWQTIAEGKAKDRVELTGPGCPSNK